VLGQSGHLSSVHSNESKSIYLRKCSEISAEQTTPWVQVPIKEFRAIGKAREFFFLRKKIGRKFGRTHESFYFPGFLFFCKGRLFYCTKCLFYCKGKETPFHWLTENSMSDPLVLWEVIPVTLGSGVTCHFLSNNIVYHSLSPVDWKWPLLFQNLFSLQNIVPWFITSLRESPEHLYNPCGW
jgi:hypothetical protein